MTISSSVALNSAYAHRRLLCRGRSASPVPRRIALAIGIFVAQRHAQMAEQIAESAISGVGQVADAIRQAREVAEAAIAEARSMHGEVESKVATLVAQADASTAHAVEEITERVREVPAYLDVQASRVIAEVTQRLESEIVAAAISTATTADVNMHTVVEEVRRDVQVQLEQTHADVLRRDEEAQHQVEQISV